MSPRTADPARDGAAVPAEPRAAEPADGDAPPPAPEAAPVVLPPGQARPARPASGPTAARVERSAAATAVERSAAAAAAERRASADAWITRAEAAVERAAPLADIAASAPVRPPPSTAAPALDDDAAWDLDLALSPTSDLSQGTPNPSAGPSSAPKGPHVDLSPGTPRPPSGPAGPTSNLSPETPGTSAELSPEPDRRGAPPAPHRPRGDAQNLSPGPGSHSAPDARAAATWVARAGAELPPDLAAAPADDARERAAAWAERAGADLGETPLLSWSELQPDLPDPPGPAGHAPEDRPATSAGYRLSTRALGPDYDRHKRAVMDAAAALKPADAARPPERPPEPAEPPPALFDVGPRPPQPDPRDMREAPGPISQPARNDPPALLACLPGPVAVFTERDALLAVDLRRVRSHLVYLRLQRDLLGRSAVAVQGLLTPAVVRRGAADVALLTAARAELLTLGVDLDAFGDDAVVVRGVPAHLRHCVDDADAADLVARIVPWLRIRDGDRAARERGLLDAIATTHGGDPAPRLARRWLAELIEAGGSLESVPGIRRWSASALLGGA